MKTICLYFQIHHPFSYRIFRFFEIGESKTWYDYLRIEREIHNTAENYYIPTNNFLLDLIHRSKGKLKFSFYLSGTSLDLFLMYSPNLINSFKQLADTGLVEFLGSTSSHSISSLAESKNEFVRQIKTNRNRIEMYFGQKPQVFVNTDLLFTDQIAQIVNETGYKAILTNGEKKILHWRSPNYLYSAMNLQKIKIIFRNELLSNKFAMILQNSGMAGNTSQEEQLITLVNTIDLDEPMLNIYMNYKVLGGLRHEFKQEFFRKLINEVSNARLFEFRLPTQLLKQFGPVSEIGSTEPICWTEYFNSSYYLGNELQKEALNQLFQLEQLVYRSKNPDLRMDWLYLQTSDHFHLLDENHPMYCEPISGRTIYKSRYDAFINYMNLLEDFKLRLKADNDLQRSRPIIRKPSVSRVRQSQD
jgi:alpha-amylase